MKNIIYQIKGLLLVIILFSSCQSEPAQQSSSETLQENSEEKIASPKAPAAKNYPITLVGTWVRSYQINDEVIEVGFNLKKDHSIEFIKMRDDYSKSWRKIGADSLQFYYRNKVTEDTLVGKSYYIDHHDPTELVLIPRNAPKNYREHYVRK